MAGEWIPMDCDLPDKRETGNICAKTGLSVEVVCGRLFLFWRWVDRLFSRPKMDGATVHTLIQIVGGDEQFWKVVEQERWVSFEEDGIVIPNWKIRFSKSSKQRMLAAKRMSRYRARQRNGSVTDASPTIEPKQQPKQQKNKKQFALLSVDEQMLSDTGRLINWLKTNPRLNGQRFHDTEQHLLFVLGAAERAKDKGDNPVGLFIDIVGNRRHDWISQAQEDRAASRLREHRATAVNGTHATDLAATFSANKDAD